MKITNYTINEAGAQEILAFLQANHKRGAALGAKELAAWVDDANFQLAEGNTATVEIGATDSTKGYAVTYTVSNDGLDEQVIEIDEDEE